MSSDNSAPTRHRIDLNADLGESFGRWRLGDDTGMLDVVTSANVACGFHAGDPATLAQACRGAVSAGVSIGAQVGYRDLPGFGRRFIDVEPGELVNDVIYQVGALDAIARTVGGCVAYIKPHGALYNAIVHHAAQARAVVEAVLRLADGGFTQGGERLPILGLPGSRVLDIAEAQGVPVVREAFADRAYAADGTLLSRRLDGAVLHDPQQVAERVVQLVTTGRVVAVDGTSLPVQAESVCVHGDSPGAVEMAKLVRTALERASVTVRSFVQDPDRRAEQKKRR